MFVLTLSSSILETQNAEFFVDERRYSTSVALQRVYACVGFILWRVFAGTTTLKIFRCTDGSTEILLPPPPSHSWRRGFHVGPCENPFLYFIKYHSFRRTKNKTSHTTDCI